MKAHFSVHPSVVFKLGEDLITDDIQAIAELIKNGYDADATRVTVHIVTESGPDEHPEDSGYIVVEDNGSGMETKTLVSGWLTISNSAKRTMKAEGRTTDRGRTPMGDKGLGRLGAQRLGNRVSIETTPGRGSVKHKMSFDWRDFEGRETLEEVPVEIRTVLLKKPKESGTLLRISDLRDTEILADGLRLRQELAKIISPYSDFDNFKLYVYLNGEYLDLTVAERQVRNAAAVSFTLDFDGETLHVKGRMRLGHLRPNGKADKLLWARVVDADRGAGLLKYLVGKSAKSSWDIQPARNSKWWLEFDHAVRLDEIRPKVDPETGEVANPGPFAGQVDSFNLGSGSVQEIGVFNTAKILRDHLRDMHGIRVYRDGFNIRVAEDWLGLGKQTTSGGSWFGLRVGTTMGYISISADDNAQLQETTDREGFSRTAAYLNYFDLLRSFVASAANVLEDIGRGAADYRRQFDIDPDDVDRDSETILDELTEILDKANEYLTPLQEAKSTLAMQAAKADQIIDSYQAVRITNPREQEMLQQLNTLSRQATKASEMVAGLEAFVASVSEQRSSAKRVQADLEMLSEQLTLTYETMAVGLTAEALAHEIGNLAERLARRSSAILRYVRRDYPADVRVQGYVREVQGVVAGLRRQLAHLAPSLRYVRERRETLSLSAVAADVSDYFEGRWGETIGLAHDVSSDFKIVMNRGKLLQVIDNIVLNSEYWLNEQVRLGTLEDPEVRIEIDAPFVRIADNGRGVDPQVEDALFEPFVSKKPKGAGRGLGLFIVKQLLDAEGCDIELDPQRNEFGRRNVFVIDLASVMSND